MYSDVNAIVIAMSGKVKLLRFQAGDNPFAPPNPAPKASNGREIGYIPDAKKLPPLTPDAFDAMFPGTNPRSGLR